jgi:DNA repair exonuclease SbcCD ATPase subunit
MALVNFESVAKAAQGLVDEGRKPSVRSVMEVLGGGSPNAVLPILNDWKSGRLSVRSSEVEIDPRLVQVVTEMIYRSSEQAAKAAEERAADTQADAEAVAEAARESEALSAKLIEDLAQANSVISKKERDLEVAQSNAAHDADAAKEKIQTLDQKLMDERGRADTTAKALARAEVRLEQVPALESEVKRLIDVEKQAAVLTANLDSANALNTDLKQRLSDALAATKAAQDETAKQSREAEKARIAEQAAQARIESAVREMETLKGVVADAKAETKAARADAAEYKTEIKQLRADIAEMIKSAKAEKAKDDKARDEAAKE